MDKDDCGNKKCASARFLQIQKNQLIQLLENLKWYANVLYVFGVNGAKYDLYSITTCLLPILVKQRDIEPNVVKKAKQFISLQLGDIHLFNKTEHSSCSNKPLFILEGLQNFRKKVFPWEKFDHPDKIQSKELPLYDAFYCKLLSCNAIEAEYTDYVHLIKKWIDYSGSQYQIEAIEAHPLLGLAINKTCIKLGSRNKWSHSKSFCGIITNQMLC